MTQDECLASPHHFTYLGTCYVGDVAYIGLSAANAPQPVTLSDAVLFAIALPVGVVLRGVGRALSRAKGVTENVAC